MGLGRPLSSGDTMISYADIITPDLIRSLIDSEGGPCCSIILSTGKPGTNESQESPLRLGNAVKTVRQRLNEGQISLKELDDKLEQAVQLRTDSLFWSHQAGTLALFISPTRFEYYRLPLETQKDIVVVSDTFHVKPLLQSLQSFEVFFILSLSQKRSELFACTRNSISRLLFEPLPNMDEALIFNDPERQLQFHTGTSPSPVRRNAMFFGHGAGTDQAEQKDYILDYFRRLDQAVNVVLTDQKGPLILAGVEYELPLYRQVSRNALVLEDGIKGNFEDATPQDLHRLALPLAERHLDRAYDSSVSWFSDDPQRHLISYSLSDIVQAAYNGAVSMLFLAENEVVPGVLDTNTLGVTHSPSLRLGDNDLTNLAAIYTYRGGGTVYIKPKEKLPAQNAVAARFRYPYQPGTLASVKEGDKPEKAEIH